MSCSYHKQINGFSFFENISDILLILKAFIHENSGISHVNSSFMTGGIVHINLMCKTKTYSKNKNTILTQNNIDSMVSR